MISDKRDKKGNYLSPRDVGDRVVREKPHASDFSSSPVLGSRWLCLWMWKYEDPIG